MNMVGIQKINLCIDSIYKIAIIILAVIGIIIATNYYHVYLEKEAEMKVLIEPVSLAFYKSDNSMIIFEEDGKNDNQEFLLGVKIMNIGNAPLTYPNMEVCLEEIEYQDALTYVDGRNIGTQKMGDCFFWNDELFQINKSMVYLIRINDLNILPKNINFKLFDGGSDKISYQKEYKLKFREPKIGDTISLVLPRSYLIES